MDVFLRAGDGRSLVTQVHDLLRDAITDGRLPVGARLTPSHVLSGQPLVRVGDRGTRHLARVLAAQTGLHVT